MAVAVVVASGSDAGPAEAFVEADGGGVFGHDVEDESAAVLVGVVGGVLAMRTSRSPRAWPRASCRTNRRPRTATGSLWPSGRSGPERSGGVVGLGFAESDVSDDVVVEFGDPCGDLVWAGEPGGGVGNAFDGIAVAVVNLHERGCGCGQVI